MILCKPFRLDAASAAARPADFVIQIFYKENLNLTFPHRLRLAFGKVQ
jgi:hypothetical protein